MASNITYADLIKKASKPSEYESTQSAPEALMNSFGPI